MLYAVPNNFLACEVIALHRKLLSAETWLVAFGK